MDGEMQVGESDRIIRIGEVLKLSGDSRSTIWRKVRAGTFPAPVRLSEEGAACGWWLSEVMKKLRSYPRVPYAPAPPESARSEEAPAAT